MFSRINQAMATSIAKRKGDEKGFTLIELLVVVLIIGILAAIAIPVYIGQQKSANDASAQSNATNAKLAIVAYGAANPSVTAVPASTALATFGFPQSGGVVISSGATTTSFTVCAPDTGGNHTNYAATATTDVTADSGTC